MSEHAFDLQYGVVERSGAEAPLLIDYNVARLSGRDDASTRCAELSDLALESPSAFGKILMVAFPFTPKIQLRRDFAAAALLLREGGVFCLQLAQLRIAPAIKRLLREVFSVVEYDSGRFECRSSHLEDTTLPMESISKFSYTDPLSGMALSFQNSPGLFSTDSLDAGTELLLDTLVGRFENISGTRILDVGCGCGVLGCVLSARGAEVTMIDCDARAVRFARRNLEANGLSGDVMAMDAAAGLPDMAYDLVVSNPPTHAGHETLYSLFDRSSRAAPQVVIVVRELLTYEKWLAKYFRVENLSNRDGYKVLLFEVLTSSNQNPVD